ncbi:MAG: monovalent cation/H(+) antiporter subunit G [Acaryochloridaceae cyanobacterium RL_2_7]|nr:monovalent cation/H(+) antiporter subunit G [Acaryochloridaceae cyanobacterium RL_2_7]
MINILSNALLFFGVLLWFWGTFPLLQKRSILFKLHTLSVSDTLGSITIVVGLLFKLSREWPLLLLAILSLTLWNTVLGYVLAYCSSTGEEYDILE